MGVILGGGNDGRFLKQWTVVILGLAGMGLAAMLLIMPRYRLQQQAMSLANEAGIKSNMRTLQVALAQYMAEDGRGYPTMFEKEGASGTGPLFEYLSSAIGRMRNPLDPDIPAVAVSWKDPPFWPLFKAGQVVYVPLDVEEGVASGYVIYGVGANGPIVTVLGCRPEFRREGGPGTEPETGQQR